MVEAASPPKDQFKILYFASAQSFANKHDEFISAPMTVKQLFSFLEEAYPGIGRKVLSSAALTINLEYVSLDEEAGETVIEAGDEVAIIPPVSSG